MIGIPATRDGLASRHFLQKENSDMLHLRNNGPIFAPLKLALMFALACMALCVAGTGSTLAQTQKGAGELNRNSAEDGPRMMDFRGISLGMSAEEVRKKLGDPKDKGDDQDFYVFNDKLTAQVLYDKSHKVVTISADFMGAGDAPTPKAVFGSDIEAKPDGSMYKMVRYPKAGCWVSYNRTAGDTPLITVTIQKN